MFSLLCCANPSFVAVGQFNSNDNTQRNMSYGIEHRTLHIYEQIKEHINTADSAHHLSSPSVRLTQSHTVRSDNSLIDWAKEWALRKSHQTRVLSS